MALPVAQKPVRVLGVNRVTVVFAFSRCVDAGYEILRRRVKRALHVEAQAMRRVVEL